MGDIAPQILANKIENAASFSRMMGGATAFAMGGDVLTAFQTAANAAEEKAPRNEFLRKLFRALVIASTLSTVYDTYDTYQTTLKQTGDKEQAATAALATLCVDVLVM